MTETAELEAPPTGVFSTHIDHAWRAAQQSTASDADRVEMADEATAAFVDVVLAAHLACPVWDDENGEPPSQDRAQPKLIPQEDGEALALFDSEDRLADYLDAPSAFIALPGHTFFELAAQHGLAIALNPGVAPSAMTFSSATVIAVAELVAAAESAGDAQSDGLIEARAPKDAPPALLTALQARLAAARGLASEGWLFEASMKEGDQPALVLGLVAPVGAEPEALRRLSVELSRLGSALLNNIQGVDREMNVALFAEGDAALERIRSVGFGMSASSPVRAEAS